jgi:hypothetical protein
MHPRVDLNVAVLWPCVDGFSGEDGNDLKCGGFSTKTEIQYYCENTEGCLGYSFDNWCDGGSFCWWCAKRTSSKGKVQNGGAKWCSRPSLYPTSGMEMTIVTSSSNLLFVHAHALLHKHACSLSRTHSLARSTWLARSHTHTRTHVRERSCGVHVHTNVNVHAGHAREEGERSATERERERERERARARGIGRGRARVRAIGDSVTTTAFGSSHLRHLDPSATNTCAKLYLKRSSPIRQGGYIVVRVRVLQIYSGQRTRLCTHARNTHIVTEIR